MRKKNPQVVLAHKIYRELAAVFLRLYGDARAEGFRELALHLQNFRRVEIFFFAHAVEGYPPRDAFGVAHRQAPLQYLPKQGLLFLRAVRKHKQWTRVPL